jgi:hypothetical protein
MFARMRLVHVRWKSIWSLERIGRLAVALCFMASALHWADYAPVLLRPAYADDMIDRIQHHIEAMYRDPMGTRPATLLKWTVPIRYQVAGANNPKARDFIDSRMAYFGELLGLDIRRADLDPGERANFYFIFATDLVATARMPQVAQLFKRRDESEDAYAARISNFNDAPTHSTYVIGKESLTFATILDNPQKSNHIFQIHVDKLIIKALTITDNSDVIQPSIWNTTPSSEKLAPVDEAFLKTLYSADIPYEATLQSAMPALLRRIAAQLI